MQLRHLPAIIVVLTAACAPKQDQPSSSRDSLATDTTSLTTKTELVDERAVWKQFVDDDLFTKLLPFDASDTVALKKWFPDAAADACDLFLKEDGTSWYKSCLYSNGTFRLSFFDFFDNAPQRFYYNGIDATDPNVVLAKGIHAGMSKEEFLGLVDIPDLAPEDNRFWAFEEEDKPGEHYMLFEFVDDKLTTLDLRFEYDSVPNVMVDFMNTWTEINLYETEEEDSAPEAHVPCGPRTYQLEEITVTQGDKEVTKHLLTVGLVQDSRTDSVQMIRRTEDGFVITALNSWAGQSPYSIRVTLKDNTWNFAEWGDALFAGESYDGVLYRDECDGNEPL